MSLPGKHPLLNLNVINRYLILIRNTRDGRIGWLNIRQIQNVVSSTVGSGNDGALHACIPKLFKIQDLLFVSCVYECALACMYMWTTCVSCVWRG